jgi:putative PIN family toxin of toxin-antitoxin system
MRLVLDTDVVVAALRSGTGASAEILRLAGIGRVRLIVSVPLVLEYEAVLSRAEHRAVTRLGASELATFLDGLIALSDHTAVYFTYRPVTRDPADELVVEAALNGRADAIVTFNRRDFGDGPSQFGIGCLLPREILEKMR